MRNTLFWDKNNTPSELHTLLHTLAEDFPVSCGEKNINLAFERCKEKDRLTVMKRDGVYLVSYGAKNLAARGIAYAFAGKECSEKMFFKTFSSSFHLYAWHYNDSDKCYYRFRSGYK